MNSFNTVKMPRKDGVFNRIYKAPYGFTNVFQLFDTTKNSKSFVQRLRLQVKIPAHNGCVNSICWSETGKYLLSGSDDQHICISHAYTHSILAYIATGHRANIFSAKFMPSAGDCKVISCSGDGIIIYSDLDNPETSMTNKFSCHQGTTYEIMTVPNDPNTFLSCGEDASVRWFDLRTKTSCNKQECKEDVLINCTSAVTALAVNPVAPYQLAVGCSDASVRIYDRRMLGTAATGNFSGNGVRAVMANFTVPEFTTNHRITSLGYSRDGCEMLVSYSSDFVYLFDIRNSKDSKTLSSPDCNKPRNSRHKSFSNQPLMKRLRVRGDWSDTGPNARPESESRGEQQPRSLHASLMQRMSDVLTSMYNNRTRSQNNDSRSPSHSEDSEMEDERNEGDAGAATGASESSPGPSEMQQEESVDVEPSYSAQVPASDENGETSGDRNEQQLTHQVESPEISENRVDFPFTAIKVSAPSISHISTSQSQNNHTENSEALNLSLQNIRQELSQHTGETAALPVVIENPIVPVDPVEGVQQSSVIDLSLNSSDLRGMDDPAAGHLQVSGIESSACPEESNASICDNILLEASGGSTRTDASHDLSSNVPQQQSDDDDVEEVLSIHPSTSESASVQVPNIYIANVQAQAEAAPSQEAAQGEVSLMMEMDRWDMDSEEDSRSPLSSSLRSENVHERVMSALVYDACTKDEEMESDDQLENYSLSPTVQRKYVGHRNARTMIKEATFWGDDYVMSGSDCGHIFIWDRHSTELVMLMEADHHVVNCLQPHPFDPILASSGIDYDIKIWAPLREEPFFEVDKADEIIKRNKIMLEETKDTITVPATFMIRMLASLNNITSGSSGWRRVARQLRDGGRNRSTR